MAPSNSQRKGKRREATPSEDGDDAANGAGAQLAAELDSLDLQHPSKTCRHLFLQVLMARKWMSVETAKAVYADCVRLCKGALGSPRPLFHPLEARPPSNEPC
jgi:hypothetical protein